MTIDIVLLLLQYHQTMPDVSYKKVKYPDFFQQQIIILNKMKIFVILFILFTPHLTFSQSNDTDSTRLKLSSSLTHIYRETMLRPGRVTVDSIALDERRKSIELHTNLPLSYLPMRDMTVHRIYDSIRYYLPPARKKYRISVFSDQQEISHLIPNHFRSKQRDRNRLISHKVKIPLVTNISAPAGSFGKGLQNNHIALWQSHGRSEEHTSELQSRPHLVCRLLLEK